jgi:hypothetical protein
MNGNLPNRLLHELDLKAHGGVPYVCAKADVWFPHVYACLRNEKTISVAILERLGHVVGKELVWRNIRQKKDNSGE